VQVNDDPALEVVALSDHEWRVCDHRLPPTDGRRLLGVIEESRNGYEVLALTPHPVNFGPFPQWDAAIRALRECRDAAAKAATAGLKGFEPATP
jgi:hypothetical protein